MTEAEWLTCSNLQQMLNFVRPQASVHKMLAFASAFDRLIPRTPDHEHDQAGSRRRAANARAPIAEEWDYQFLINSLSREVLRRARQGDSLSDSQQREVMRASCDLLRDVFAPFQSVLLAPYWLSANDGAVRKLAAFVYGEQAFDQLFILADALEEAGCTDAEILGHLRSPGPHVRGCWPVDAILAQHRGSVHRRWTGNG